MLLSPAKVASVVLNMVSDAVLVLDDQNLVLSANERFYLWTDFSAEEVLGHDARDFWEDPVRWSDWLTGLRLGGAQRDTEVLELRTRDGDAVTVEVRWATVTGIKGPALGTVLVLHDLRPHKQMERLFREDALTGVASRVAILRRLEEELFRCEKFATPLGIVLMDVDDFRALNDRWGPSFGDEVLRVIGAELRDVTRPVDSVGRLGNDEFLLLLPQTTQTQAVVVAERLSNRFERRLFVPEGTPVKVTVSYGVTMSLPTGHDTVNSVLSRVVIPD